MAKFRISNDMKKKLEQTGQEKAKKLAQETCEKLSAHYHSLIDWYYSEKPALDKYGEPYYHRTYSLYKSYRPYYKNSHNSVYYGGVEITVDKMKDYLSLNGEGFSAKALMDKFIFNPTATWHGGDWHGGYGQIADVNIYSEMNKYYNKLLNEYSKKCSV